MGQKIKPRQQRKPRSSRDMILYNKEAPYRDKKERRQGNARKNWENHDND